MTRPVFKSTSTARQQQFVVRFPAGATIFHQGELGREMYIVQSGTVEIVQGSGAAEQPLARLEKGDFFGEMAVLEDLPRSATARAVSDCRLVRVDGATFDQMLRDNREIAIRMMRKLSRRLRETDQRLHEALGDDQPGAGASPPAVAPAEPVERRRRLTHPASGRHFELAAGPETSLGRRDPVTGIHPDLDLSEIDEQRSTSRRHAKIRRDGERFLLVEEIGTVNGTFLNGERLATGVPHQLEVGDRLRLGVVELVFAEG